MGAANEVWRDVPGFEGRYQVSDRGQVKSLLSGGRILRPARQYRGHQQVVLCRDGKENHYYVHRLVLLAFVGPCPAGQEVCHNDSNPANNALENLRYDTRSHNAADRYLANNGRDQKLTADDVRQIRRRLATGEMVRSVARAFAVSESNISCIKTGRSWAWLT